MLDLARMQRAYCSKSLDAWREARDQIETNVFGALWITQAALPYLRAQRSGHLIQVSSIGGITAFQNVGIYHASKWALEGFSQALAQEIESFGVHVTLIEPGGFSTDWAGPSSKRATPLPPLAVSETLPAAQPAWELPAWARQAWRVSRFRCWGPSRRWTWVPRTTHEDGGRRAPRPLTTRI